jgi:hypothetical protein
MRIFQPITVVMKLGPGRRWSILANTSPSELVPFHGGSLLAEAIH